MIGYLSPDRSGLSAREHKDYFRSYCGLCEQLKQDYGRWARFLVNRDAVMLMMLAEAQSSESPSSRAIGCGVNPWRHHARATPEAARFAAAVSIVLVAGKLIDIAHDTRGIASFLVRWFCLAALRFFSGARAKAEATLRDQGFDPSELDALQASQHQVEATSRPSLEEAARASSEGAGLLFAHTSTLAGAPDRADQVRELGRAMGRAVYLTDARDDLDADLRRGHFNALLACAPSLDDAQDLADEAMSDARAQALRALHSIPWYRHGVLLQNIVSNALGDPIEPAACDCATQGSPRSWLERLWRPAPADCDCCCDADCCCGDGHCCCDNPACGEGCSWCACDCCDSCCWWSDRESSSSRRGDPNYHDDTSGSRKSRRRRRGSSQEIVNGTRVYAQTSDGYWNEAEVKGFQGDLYNVVFKTGAAARISRAQITLGTDPPPQGFEAVVPGTRVKAESSDGTWLKGTIVSRFGRIYSVELPDGRAAWCDTSKLRITGDEEAQVTKCPHCGATVQAGDERCSYCSTQLRT
jgi:hypothetical protein